MTESKRRPTSPRSVGPLLQHWRRTRNLSQLALAHQAAVSPRHVSFIETGRSSPSRDMILHLADALAVPLRERNALLLAAGFAPMFRESRLDDAALAPVRAAVEAILAQQEPYPAVVMNRTWDILTTNAAATRFFGRLLDGRSPTGTPNVLRLMFDPDGLRPTVVDWELTARALLSASIARRWAVSLTRHCALSSMRSAPSPESALVAQPDYAPRAPVIP